MKIIISIHISSLKKVLKKMENGKKIKSSFYLLKVSFFDIIALVALENFVWAHAPEPTWSLEIDFGSKGIQNQKFRFSPIFLTNIEFGQIKQKVENGSCSRHSCVNHHDFKCMYDMSKDPRKDWQTLVRRSVSA